MNRRRFVKTVGASAGTLALGRSGILNAAAGGVESPASQPTQGPAAAARPGARGTGGDLRVEPKLRVGQLLES